MKFLFIVISVLAISCYGLSAPGKSKDKDKLAYDSIVIPVLNIDIAAKESDYIIVRESLMAKVKKYSREIEQARSKATKSLGKSNDEIERQEFILDQKKKAAIGQEQKFKDEIIWMEAAIKNLEDKQR